MIPVMGNSDDALLLPQVLEIAREAGREIMDVYSRDFTVSQKSDRTPLTQADLRSQGRILSGLRRLTPDVPVLAEESASVPWSERRGWHEYWLVDPLDGTREFVSRNPEFTVNIALIRDHCPVLGVVHVPAQALDYYGISEPGRTAGYGAFRQLKGRAPVPIRIAVPAASPLRVVGSKSHRGDSLDALLARLGPHELKPIGSSLKLCLVAEGAADFYPRLGPTMEWDTAAAQAVAEAAGAHVVNLQGQPLRYNTREDLTNPHFVAYADTSHDWLRYVAPEG
jgi:3'(2'), 5'-bisphosphate nucleotidase